MPATSERRLGRDLGIWLGAGACVLLGVGVSIGLAYVVQDQAAKADAFWVTEVGDGATFDDLVQDSLDTSESLDTIETVTATPRAPSTLASAYIARSCGADGTADCFVSVRSSASPSASELRRLSEGDDTKVRCQTTGPAVYSSVLDRSSSVWSQLSSGGYVANVYLEGPRIEPTRRTLKRCG